MPLHIETELAGYKVQRKALAAKVAEREGFMETFEKDAAEALRLHATTLENDKRQLLELDALIAKQEAAVSAAQARVQAELESAATGQQTPGNGIPETLETTQT